MIAIDSSSLIAHLSGETGDDVDAVDASFNDKQAVLPPVVLSEILSDPKLPKKVAILIKEIPLMPLMDGYWERVGFLRSQIIVKGHKARLADTMIAQSCLDHGISLITRDTDFRHFAHIAGLKLLLHKLTQKNIKLRT